MGYVMGAMLLTSALTEVFPLVLLSILIIFPGGDFLCLGRWLGTWRLCAVPDAQ